MGDRHGRRPGAEQHAGYLAGGVDRDREAEHGRNAPPTLWYHALDIGHSKAKLASDRVKDERRVGGTSSARPAFVSSTSRAP